jgi:hypothetical protein
MGAETAFSKTGIGLGSANAGCESRTSRKERQTSGKASMLYGEGLESTQCWDLDQPEGKKGGASGDKAVGELGTQWVGRDWLAADAKVVTGGEQWEGGAPGEAGWEEAIIPLFVE